MDDLARMFFPDNKNHRRAFLAVWLEIKYGENQFLPSRFDLTHSYRVSSRTLEIVRAKMKRLGLIKRVSHFNPAHGHQAGWTFGVRFQSCLADLREKVTASQNTTDRPVDEKKDRDTVFYV